MRLGHDAEHQRTSRDGSCCTGHVICPFEHLGSDVDKECIRRPTAKDHDFSGGVVHDEEEGHSGT